MNHLYTLACKPNSSAVSSLPRMAKRRFQNFGCVRDFAVDRSFKVENLEKADYKLQLLLEPFTVLWGRNSQTHLKQLKSDLLETFKKIHSVHALCVFQTLRLVLQTWEAFHFSFCTNQLHIRCLSVLGFLNNFYPVTEAPWEPRGKCKVPL